MASPSLSGAGSCGLSNLGNTCYMNSALQCLSHTTPFAQFILSQRDGVEQQADKGLADMSLALKSLLTEMRGSSQIVTPSAFREALVKKLPQFEGNAQHDASEFISALLNCLDEELRGPAGEASAAADGSHEPSFSDVYQLFSGSLCNIIRCPACHGDFRMHERFLCLPLPLPVTDMRVLSVTVLWPLRSDCTQYALEMPWWTCVEDVLEALRKTALLTSYLRLAVVSEHRVRRVLPANHSVSDISPFDKLYAFVLEPLPAVREVGSPAPLVRPAEPPVDTTSTRNDETRCSTDVEGQRALKRARSGDDTQKTCEEEGERVEDAVAPPLQDENLLANSERVELSAPNVAIALPPPAEAIALPPPSADEVIGLPAADAVLALPPASDVIALPPPSEAIALPAPEGALSVAAPADPNEEDVQQVSCVCDVSGDVARLALRRCSNQVQDAVILLLENPQSVMEGISSVGATETSAGSVAKLALGAAEPPADETAGEQAGVPPAAQAVEAAMPQLPGEIVLSAAPAPEETPLEAAQRTLADAVAAANVSRVQAALSAGADANASGTARKPLLHLAISSAVHGRLMEKHVTTIRTLLQARADATARDESERTLSHCLAETGANTLLTELRESGIIELEAQDKSGQTLLHKAAAGKHASTVALILQWGANSTALDNKNLTPANIATSSGAEDVLDELLDRPRLLFLVHRSPSEDIVAHRAAQTENGSAIDASTAALAAKEAGNICLKAGNFPGAIEQYTLGITIASDLESGSTITADCYNNRAAVHVQLRNYENVVADTTQCLERSPLNGKALVRRAQAYQQLEKMKAAYADASTALNTTTLSEGFAKMARTVMKEVRDALLADGVDVSSLDSCAPPPVVGAGVSNVAQSKFRFAARPCALAVPRSRALSGSELYLLAWRAALCKEDEPPSKWNFELRSVSSDAEDDGTVIPCDEFAVQLQERGSTMIAMEWSELPEDLKNEPAISEHCSVAELRSKKLEKIPLQTCLDALVEDRELGDDDAWHCPTCDRKQLATIQTVIEQLPRVLVLQLKRFYYTIRRSGKISSLIDFPTKGLDMRPWFCTGSSNDSSSGSMANVDPPMLFDLFAVVNHFGGLRSGHYTANAQQSDGTLDDSGSIGAWHNFNDGVCKPILEDQLVTRDAYILFYKQKELS